MMGSIPNIVLLILLSSLSVHFTLAANSSSLNSIKCRESEWRALMEFKATLSNDSSSSLSSWTGRDCCSWYGITCDNSTGHVQILDLSYALSMSPCLLGMSPCLNPLLSPWLFNLTHLQVLSMSGCGFRGPIPNMFEKLTTLAILDLSGNSFNSSFPDSLCSLTSLSEMYLSDSLLKGCLPPCLGNMTSLAIMDLGGNDLSGKIPSEMGNMTSLTTIILTANFLSGKIPSELGNLRHLTMFDFSSCPLNSSIPSSLGHLSELKYLYLFNNQLSGAIPLTLGNLTKLSTLSLNANSLMGELSESFFQGLSSLQILDLSRNKGIVLKVSPQWIPPFRIRDLNMPSVSINTEFPPWLQTQRYLEYLDMSNANISGDIPEWCLTAFPNLIEIDLSNNLLTGSLPTFDGSASVSLQYLQLSGNQLSGSIPQELCNLKSLEFLYLANNQHMGTIPSCLGSLRNLSALDLGDNNFSGHIPNELGFLSNLVSLHLNGNKLYGKLPESLLKLESLITLDLGENDFHGSIPRSIGIRWPALQHMRLESNSISGDIPVNLCHLQYLQILNLALNSFTGTIPPCFGNLAGMMSVESGDIYFSDEPFSSIKAREIKYSSNKAELIGMSSQEFYGTRHLYPIWPRGSGYSEALEDSIKGREMKLTSNLQYAKFISLSGNHLHGEIPVELMKLNGLQSLNLSNNDLTGMIPETINNLTNLESLDLSANQLSGNIPQSLTDIDNLSYLNLSFNNLGGRIPSGNHFDTLDNSSFYQGNEQLCGKPLKKSCPGDHSAVSNQPSEPVSDGDDEFDGLPWVYAGIGPGFAVGFLGVICTLYFKDEWRIAFFGFTDDVYNKVWVAFAIKISQFRSKFN